VFFLRQVHPTLGNAPGLEVRRKLLHRGRETPSKRNNLLLHLWKNFLIHVYPVRALEDRQDLLWHCLGLFLRNMGPLHCLMRDSLLGMWFSVSDRLSRNFLRDFLRHSSEGKLCGVTLEPLTERSEDRRRGRSAHNAIVTAANEGIVRDETVLSKKNVELHGIFDILFREHDKPHYPVSQDAASAKRR
jgi:hypothetical protein